MVLGSSKRRWEEASRREAREDAMRTPEERQRREEEKDQAVQSCMGCGCFAVLLFLAVTFLIALAMPSSPYCPTVC
jgi:hypothetical protein